MLLETKEKFVIKLSCYVLVLGILLFIIGLIWYSVCNNTEKELLCGGFSTKQEKTSKNVVIAGAVLITQYIIVLCFLFIVNITKKENV